MAGALGGISVGSVADGGRDGDCSTPTRLGLSAVVGARIWASPNCESLCLAEALLLAPPPLLPLRLPSRESSSLHAVDMLDAPDRGSSVLRDGEVEAHEGFPGHGDRWWIRLPVLPLTGGEPPVATGLVNGATKPINDGETPRHAASSTTIFRPRKQQELVGTMDRPL